MARKSKSQAEDGGHSLSSAPLGIEVHPAANIFPMMDDEQLASLADSVGRNGLRHKIVVWVNNGHEVMIDGRNRFRACELAGVEPEFDRLEGDENAVLAYIADANLMRRDLKFDQRIMAYARIYPEPQRGFKVKDEGDGSPVWGNVKKSLKTVQNRLHEARVLLKYEDLWRAVLAGTRPLRNAFAEAQKRDFEAKSDESKLADLKQEAPDLAEMVPDRISLSEALSAWETRKKDEAERLKNMIHGACVALTESVRHLQDMSRQDTQGEYEALLENESFLKQMEGIESANPDEIRGGFEFLIKIIDEIRGARA